MVKELAKAYEPQKYEDKIYKRWEESGFFNPDVCMAKGICDKNARPFTIILPPPNATGSLHIGHVMMLAIEDLMIRYHRMKGDKTLWLPGTDHAAIATNAIVEKQLAKEGKTKNDLGREKYVAKVKDFIKKSQDNIRNQVRKMGSSLDWSREAYTWDEDRNLAVRTMFKKMYNDGLIYQGFRIVNWCPHCQSTLADDEVEYDEKNAKLYTFKYSKDFPIAIATTRPETKLGDVAVAINPKDKRMKKYLGKSFTIARFAGGPNLNIQIIADENVDIGFGTGAVGVTPAHSFVDNEMAQKNKLSSIKIIDEQGKMTEKASEAYEGLTVRQARDKVVEFLAKEKLLVGEPKDITNNLSTCYRCHNPIEPLPSKQWFIDVNKEFRFKQSKCNPIRGLENEQSVTLKKLMQQVVNNGQIEIIPDRFNKIYFHWIDNLRDWCISRQIWVGHRIPIWYRGEEMYVGVAEPDGDGWQQDQDTLDTWFSSGLWTFSTLGWPQVVAKDLQIYHPTSVLETMFDILFFWVARMIMMTTYALGEIPFKKVYLHARVLDKDGEKMSKSKPETMIDPLDVCQRYGTDAVRLSLLLGVSPGADIRLSEDKIQGFRNFANKLWNICRFMLININEPKDNIHQPEPETDMDRAILHRLNDLIVSTSASLEKFNFSQAGESLRDFTWSELADWYLEIAKIEGNKLDILNYILNTILKLWHPFMPFVTETIWQEIYGKDKMLMVEKWPALASLRDATAGKSQNATIKDFELIQNIITGIRSLRSDYKIDPVKKLDAMIGAGKRSGLLKENEAVIKGLARLEKIKIDSKITKSENFIGFVVSGVEVYIDIAGVIDMEKEKGRLKKEIVELERYAGSLAKKLTNKKFVKNAPKKIVAKEQQKFSEAKEKLVKLQKQLENIKK